MITFEEVDIKTLYYKKTDIQLWNFLMTAIHDKTMLMGGFSSIEKLEFILENFRININYKANYACLWYLGGDRITLKGLMKISTQKYTISNNWPNLGHHIPAGIITSEMFSYFYEVDGLTFMLKENLSDYYFRKIEGYTI